MKHYWYNHFLALPQSKESMEYKRIERIFRDQTRFRGKKDTEKRMHELINTGHETNLTVTLWGKLFSI